MECAYTILSSVACCTLQYFSTLSNKGHEFRGGKKVTEPKMCFDFLCKFVRKISHSKKNGARYDQKCILVLNIPYSAR